MAPIVEYKIATGETVRSRSTVFVNINLSKYKLGDTVQVYYDPKRPQVFSMNAVDGSITGAKITWVIFFTAAFIQIIIGTLFAFILPV